MVIAWKKTLRSAKLKLPTESDEAEDTPVDMSTADVPKELKEELMAFRSEFNTKTDATCRHLNDMTNSIAALEGTIVSIKTEVSSITKRVADAEQRISNAEDKQNKDGAVLTKALKRIAELEAKTNKLEA